MENLFGIFLSAKEAKLDQFQEKEKESDQIKEVKEEIIERQRNIRKKGNGIKKIQVREKSGEMKREREKDNDRYFKKKKKKGKRRSK